MAVIKRKDIFPFGTHFYREPALPLEELKRDMRTMKKLGFNTKVNICEGIDRYIKWIKKRNITL